MLPKRSLMRNSLLTIVFISSALFAFGQSAESCTIIIKEKNEKVIKDGDIVEVWIRDRKKEEHFLGASEEVVIGDKLVRYQRKVSISSELIPLIDRSCKIKLVFQDKYAFNYQEGYAYGFTDPDPCTREIKVVLRQTF